MAGLEDILNELIPQQETLDAKSLALREAAVSLGGPFRSEVRHWR